MTDKNNNKKPGGAGPALLAIPMVLCCAVPLIFIILASGALAGFFAWLSDGGAVTIGLAVIAGVLGVGFYKSKAAPGRRKHALDVKSHDR